LNLFTNDRTEWIVGPLINVGANDSLSVDVAVTDFNSITDADAMGSDDKVAIMVTTNCGVSWSPFYSFTATNYTQTIQVAGSASFDPVVEVYDGTCGALTSLSCTDNTFSGGTETVSVSGLTLYP
jgi:hypothetical protein